MSLYVTLPPDLAERVRQLAQRDGGTAKRKAEALLAEALHNRADEAAIVALASAFEAEGQRWFREADSPSATLMRRLLLQTRGEAWFQAASRLRNAISESTPIEARTAPPADDRPTAA